MIDYLQGLIAGREDGVAAGVRIIDEEPRGLVQIMAADAVGIMILTDGFLKFLPWHTIRFITIEDRLA